jgi:hypothetical protein
MPSIEVDYPMVGSHVLPVFAANGTYVGTFANITCKLVDATGATVMNGVVSAGTNPATDWKADFDLSAVVLPLRNLTLRPEIVAPSDTNDQDDITVEAAPPMQMDRLPRPPASPAPPAPAPLPAPVALVAPVTVTGTHAAAVTEILCVAIRYNGKNGEKILGNASAALNTPAAGQWTATIPLSHGVPPGWKLAVFAQARAGAAVVAKAHRRRGA